MKNIIIIVLSVVLAHFKLPSASTEYIVDDNGFDTRLEQLAPEFVELPELVINIPALTVKEAEIPSKEKITFKARKSINIQSQKNTDNRNFHQELSTTSRVERSENLHFHFDDFELKNNEDFNKILSLADQLIFNPNLKVSLSGNTDFKGSEYYNDVLSYNRVENVKTYLLELGVSPDQIISSFNGETQPVADNETDEGRAENRRVEIIVYQ